VGVARASGPHFAPLGLDCASKRRATPHCIGRSTMGVIIIREMVGSSATSWSDAAARAVATASKTVRNIRSVEVVRSTARVENGEIVEYQVELKLAFEYEG
jgi:flavin-binding protein dodecin